MGLGNFSRLNELQGRTVTIHSKLGKLITLEEITGEWDSRGFEPLIFTKLKKHRIGTK